MTRTVDSRTQVAADEDDLLHMEEVSAITRMTIDTLRHLRHAGGGPPSFRLGRRVVYSRSELREWMRERKAATLVDR